MSKRLSSKLIGFNVPNTDFNLWTQFCNNKYATTVKKQKKSKDPKEKNPPKKKIFNYSAFIRQAVANYINPGTETSDSEGNLFILDNDLVNSLPGVKYINIRLDILELATWDKFCNKYMIDRTALVLEATRKKMNPKRPQIFGDIKHELEILNNLVREWGLIEYNLIENIISTVDSDQLTGMLNKLEAESHIMRKGLDMYVPTEAQKFMYVSTETQKTPFNFRFLIEYFNRLLSVLAGEENSKHIRPKPKEDLELSDIDSLNRVIFEFLRYLVQEFGSGSGSRTKNSLLKIDELDREIHELIYPE